MDNFGAFLGSKFYKYIGIALKFKHHLLSFSIQIQVFIKQPNKSKYLYIVDFFYRILGKG